MTQTTKIEIGKTYKFHVRTLENRVCLTNLINKNIVFLEFVLFTPYDKYNFINYYRYKSDKTEYIVGEVYDIIHSAYTTNKIKDIIYYTIVLNHNIKCL